MPGLFDDLPPEPAKPSALPGRRHDPTFSAPKTRAELVRSGTLPPGGPSSADLQASSLRAERAAASPSTKPATKPAPGRAGGKPAGFAAGGPLFSGSRLRSQASGAARSGVDEGAGVLLGLVVYALAHAYLAGGPALARQWLAAKFLNRTGTPAAAAATTGRTAPLAPAGPGPTVRTAPLVPGGVLR